jgi:hypothetical protein
MAYCGRIFTESPEILSVTIMLGCMEGITEEGEIGNSKPATIDTIQVSEISGITVRISNVDAIPCEESATATINVPIVNVRWTPQIRVTIAREGDTHSWLTEIAYLTNGASSPAEDSAEISPFGS